MSILDQLYAESAKLCEDAGIPMDAEPNGAVHQWVLANCRFRPGTEFFIVHGIVAAMCDREAQREGYRDQIDRAAQFATRAGVRGEGRCESAGVGQLREQPVRGAEVPRATRRKRRHRLV